MKNTTKAINVNRAAPAHDAQGRTIPSPISARHAMLRGVLSVCVCVCACHPSTTALTLPQQLRVVSLQIKLKSRLQSNVSAFKAALCLPN